MEKSGKQARFPRGIFRKPKKTFRFPERNVKVPIKRKAIDELEDYVEKTIVKRGNKWLVVAESTGKTLGTHDSKKDALNQLRAVEANKSQDDFQDWINKQYVGKLGVGVSPFGGNVRSPADLGLIFDRLKHRWVRPEIGHPEQSELNALAQKVSRDYAIKVRDIALKLTRKDNKRLDQARQTISEISETPFEQMDAKQRKRYLEAKTLVDAFNIFRIQIDKQSKQFNSKQARDISRDNAISIFDNWISKQNKVYLKPGEKPPQGVRIQVGKRGGKYYIEIPRRDREPEKLPSLKETGFKSFPDVEEVKEMFDDIVKFSKTYQITRQMHKLRNMFKKVYKDNFALYPHEVQEVFEGWKESSDTIMGRTFLTYSLMLKNPNLNIEEAVTKIASEFELKRTTERKFSKGEIAKIAEWFEEKRRFFDAHRQIIQEVFKGKTVTLYRGANGQTIEEGVRKGQEVELSSMPPLSRWSLRREAANSFAIEKRATGQTAYILKAEVSADRLLYVEGISLANTYIEEVEFGIDGDGLKATVENIIKGD